MIINMNLNNLQSIPPALLYFFYIWSLLWKGLALWRAAKYSQRNWFIVTLIINTLGLLDIIYLFGFAKKRLKLNDLMFWQKNQE